MTRQQYRRWYDFARRMALRGFPDATPARRAKIAKKVRHILWILEDDVPDIVDWDNAPSYVCDAVDRLLSEDRYHERYSKNGEVKECGNRFLNQVSCCIRAGLDMASEPSAGVVGFTVGDLRRMYPFGLPAWVAIHFTTPITADVDDAAGVWL